MSSPFSRSSRPTKRKSGCSPAAPARRRAASRSASGTAAAKRRETAWVATNTSSSRPRRAATYALDVRPVRGDGVGVPVQVARRQPRQRVRGRARVGPDRRPEDERHARAPRCEVARGQRDPPAHPADHGAVAPGRGEPRRAALRGHAEPDARRRGPVVRPRRAPRRPPPRTGARTAPRGSARPRS